MDAVLPTIRKIATKEDAVRIRTERRAAVLPIPNIETPTAHKVRTEGPGAMNVRLPATNTGIPGAGPRDRSPAAAGLKAPDAYLPDMNIRKRKAPDADPRGRNPAAADLPGTNPTDMNPAGTTGQGRRTVPIPILPIKGEGNGRKKDPKACLFFW